MLMGMVCPQMQERGAGLGADMAGVDLYVPPAFRVSGKEAATLAAEAASLASGRELPSQVTAPSRAFEHAPLDVCLVLALCRAQCAPQAAECMLLSAWAPQSCGRLLQC